MHEGELSKKPETDVEGMVCKFLASYHANGSEKTSLESLVKIQELAQDPIMREHVLDFILQEFCAIKNMPSLGALGMQDKDALEFLGRRLGVDLYKALPRRTGKLRQRGFPIEKFSHVE